MIKQATLIRLILISLIATFSFVNTALAAKADNQGKSTEWVKFDLESKLQSRIEQNLSGLLGEVDFLVNVHIELEDVKAKPKTADAKPNGFIFLDRLGMWTVSGKKAQGEGFFESIKKINVKAVVPKEVMEGSKEAIQVAVDSGLLGFPEGIRDIKIEELPARGVANNDYQIGKESLLKYSGLLLPVLLLCFTYFFVSFLESKWGKGQASVTTQMGEGSVAPALGGNERDVTPLQAGVTQPIISSGGGELAPTSFNSGQMVGFNSFKSLVSEQPRVASLLIKQWVNSGDAEAHSCLMAISRSDFVSELLPLLHNLNSDERRKWQSVNRGLPLTGFIASANNFLAKSLFDRELVPPLVEDSKIETLLSELNVEDCVGLAEKNPEVLAQLLNILPATKVSGILKAVDAGVAEVLIDKSIDFDREKDLDLQALQRVVKGLVQERSVEKSSPFRELLDDIVMEMDAEKEQLIFGHMIKSGDKESYVNMAKKHFPAELVWDLPQNFLRAFITQMNSKERSELIFSQDEDAQNKFFEILGEGKLRDMLDLEIGEIKENFAVARKLQEQQKELWQNFLASLRQTLKANPEVYEQAQNIIENSTDKFFSDEAPDDFDVEKAS